MDTGITTDFGDGVYRFHLLLPQVVELERVHETSILDLDAQLSLCVGVDHETSAIVHVGGGPNVRVILDVIRLGLIGGNNGTVTGEETEVGPTRAKQLVEAYCWPATGGIGEAAALAASIVFAAVRGIDLKKKAAPAEADDLSGSEKD